MVVFVPDRENEKHKIKYNTVFSSAGLELSIIFIIDCPNFTELMSKTKCTTCNYDLIVMGTKYDGV